MEQGILGELNLFKKEFSLSKWGLKHFLSLCQPNRQKDRWMPLPEFSRIYPEASFLPKSEPFLSLASLFPLQRVGPQSFLYPCDGVYEVLKKNEDVMPTS